MALPTAEVSPLRSPSASPRPMIAHQGPRGSQGSRSPTEPSSTPLREAELIHTAERLEQAYDREARIVALNTPDREAILRVLEDCPEELAELRATLLQERVWRKREGFA